MKTDKNQKTKSTLLYQFLKLVKVKKFYFCDFWPFSPFFGGVKKMSVKKIRHTHFDTPQKKGENIQKLQK